MWESISENKEKITKNEVKSILDRNFKMTSDLLTLIYKKDFNEQTDLEKIRDISSDLMLNLSNIWPYLIEKWIYNEEEYYTNFQDFFLTIWQTDNIKDLRTKSEEIKKFIDFFINKKSRNTINTEDIWWKVNFILDNTFLEIPFRKIIWRAQWIDKKYLNDFEILKYRKEFDKRILFIPWINTVRQAETEITSPDYKWNKDPKVFYFDWVNKVEAYGQWWNLDWLLEGIAEDYQMWIDLVSSYYFFQRSRIEEIIKKIQEYLETEDWKKIEVIIWNSYWWMIAQALDLSNTNIKKVIQVATPFSKPSAMLISVPRENYARKLAKRNVKFFSFWFNWDTFVKPETSRYSNEPHKTVKSANWHCEWFYYKFVNPEIYREFLDFAWLKRKK